MNKRYRRRLKYWQRQRWLSQRGALNMDAKERWVGLNKHLAPPPPVGEASQACRWESTCCGEKTAAHRYLWEMGAPRGFWEIPANQHASSGFRRNSKTDGGREAKMAFKPGLPSEGADNKETAKVWEAGGGCVKLTAALNPSSRRGLDPIRPAQPRTAWQGLSCRRHQRADEDGGPSVRHPPPNSTNL